MVCVQLWTKLTKLLRAKRMTGLLCYLCTRDTSSLQLHVFTNRIYNRLPSSYATLCSKRSRYCLSCRHVHLCKQVNTGTINSEHAHLIKTRTKLSRDHMTPEVALHLITKECELWDAKPDVCCPFPDPFWAFYWPGGQVMTRYILDNPAIFKDHVILDVGSGCGASSIAAAMVGARQVIANDVDPFAVCAIKLNAAENRVPLEVVSDDLIGQLNDQWTTVLLGDMFYDLDFRDLLVDWLTHHTKTFKSNVFIGDPGRLPLLNDPIIERLTKVAEYDLPSKCIEENNGLTKGYVWKLSHGNGDNIIQGFFN